MQSPRAGATYGAPARVFAARRGISEQNATLPLSSLHDPLWYGPPFPGDEHPFPRCKEPVLRPHALKESVPAVLNCLASISQPVEDQCVIRRSRLAHLVALAFLIAAVWTFLGVFFASQEHAM